MADLDLIIFTTHQQRYLASSGWLTNFGKTLVTHLEKAAVGDELERRAIFEGGLDVDFSILSVEQLAENVERPNLQDLDMIRRGVRVLLDKTGTIQKSLSGLLKEKMPAHASPSLADFEQLINDFLYHVYWTAKKLRRGELWTAQACCDGYLKKRLLTMIEWNARGTRGWTTDVWFNGRYLEEWAAPEVLKALQSCFSYYDPPDVERALFATTELFLSLAKDTGDKLGYSLSRSPVEPILELTRKCLGRQQPK